MFYHFSSFGLRYLYSQGSQTTQTTEACQWREVYPESYGVKWPLSAPEGFPPLIRHFVGISAMDGQYGLKGKIWGQLKNKSERTIT